MLLLDIKASNILMRLTDHGIFSGLEDAEKEDPTPYKSDGHRRESIAHGILTIQTVPSFLS